MSLDGCDAVTFGGMTLIAEDVLLLLLDDTKGTVSAWGNTDAVLGGAVLAELAVLGLATVDEKNSIWRAAKVHATGGAPADLDPVLAEALATIAEKDRKASTLVTKLGKGLKDRLAAGLAQRRILERRDGKQLGLVPRTTWPAADTSRADQLRRRSPSAWPTVPSLTSAPLRSSPCSGPPTRRTRRSRPTPRRRRDSSRSAPRRSPTASGPPRRSRTPSPRPPRAQAASRGRAAVAKARFGS